MIRHQLQQAKPSQRVVILGGTGFVGKTLARQLEATGVETVALSSTQVDLTAPNAADSLREIIRARDVVVMAAALTPDRGKDFRATMTNLTMVVSLCESLQHANCSQVIYVSSDAVYDDVDSPINESTLCCPKSLYGQMHLMRERMLAETLEARKCPLFVLRPCALYGADDTHISYGPNRFVRSAQSDRRIALFGRGEEKRDHAYVEDLCHLIGLAIERRSEGILNVATGQSISFASLASQVAGMQEDEVRIECSERRTPITHRHFDTTEIAKAFPTFRFTPLNDGLLASRAGLVSKSTSLQEAR